MFETKNKPADWHVHVRGEIRNPGPVVPRGFLTVATPADVLSAQRSCRRQHRQAVGGELAEWIASPENPLTARVFVNRVWLHVMGKGIVRTPDNFGETGERPTHPELLDYLADTFITEDNWSTKKLVRRLCLTSAFRMASDVSGDSSRLDPENLQLTRAFRRRLDAESIRDSLLQISGALDLSIQSGRTFEKLSTYDNEFHHDEHPVFCRSVYVPSFRNTMLDMFEVFDVANPNIVSGKRINSLRPAQSLFMLNSPFVMDQARTGCGDIPDVAGVSATRSVAEYYQCVAYLSGSQSFRCGNDGRTSDNRASNQILSCLESIVSQRCLRLWIFVMWTNSRDLHRPRLRSPDR